MVWPDQDLLFFTTVVCQKRTCTGEELALSLPSRPTASIWLAVPDTLESGNESALTLLTAECLLKMIL